MRKYYFTKPKEKSQAICRQKMLGRFALFFFSLLILGSEVSAQVVLFDFDSATPSSPLPVDQTVSGITAHFTGTGQGYSIQSVNTMGFTPSGFSGLCIYPSSVYLADLLINFNQAITEFSIMYSCQELACDDAATMRVTAFTKGSLVGSNTMVARHPGTWPVDTLRCNFAQGFDSVVVHYDSRPPTCQDYGVIFLVDNMRVTALNPVGIKNQKIFNEAIVVPNPVIHFANISFSLNRSGMINISVYDITGKLIKNLVNGSLNSGPHQVKWDVSEAGIKAGVYILKISGENFSRCSKLVVAK